MAKWSDKKPEAKAAVVEAPKAETEDAKPEGWRPDPRNEARRLAMESIDARDAETKKTELVPEKEEKPAEPAVQEAPSEAPAPEAAPTPVVETEPVVDAPVAPVMVKVKVDGQEFEVSQADIDAAGSVPLYQREKALENRMAKTSEQLAETRKAQAAIAHWLQQQTPAKPVETDDQFIASKIDTIRFGTAEESTKALQEVLQRNRIDANAVVQQANSVMQQNLALSQFKKEFQDVVANPMLLRLAVSLENEGRAELKDHPDWDTFYRTIGNKVRSVTRQSQPAAAPIEQGTTSPVSEKEARKSSIVTLPTAAARAALPKEEKPETREDILNEMRKSRGIPTG